MILLAMTALNIATWNIRGLKHGAAELRMKLDSCNVMFLTEHWLDDHNASQLENLHDDFMVFYKCSCDLNSHQRGSGGVAMFIRKGDWCKVTSIDTSFSSHTLCAKLNIGTTSVIVLGTRLPSTNVLDSVYLNELYYVMDTYDMCSQQCYTVLLGDFNTDIRDCVQGKVRSRCLLRMLSERHLYSVVPLDDSTRHSFHSKCNSYKTLIDYVFVDINNLPNIIGHLIDTNIPYSISDHLPILVCINTTVREVYYGSGRLNWRRASETDLMLYRYETESYFRNTAISKDWFSSSEEYIEHYCEFITTSLHAAAATSIPSTRYKPYLKPYWKRDGLKPLHNDMRNSRKNWLHCGKPREAGDPSFIRYKEAKRIFRRQNRRSKKSMLNRKFTEIYEAAEVDINEFYKTAKRHKRKQGNIDKLSYNSTSACNASEICSLFGQYFSDLANPSSTDHYDQVHADYVRSEISDTEARDSLIYDPNCPLLCSLSVEEVMCSVKRLKMSKSPGPDGLVNEHFKRSGRSLVNHIALLFNAIIEYEYIPKSFTVGLILPIHKGHGKSKCDPANYRGITMTSALSKLFERLLLNRIETWTDRHVEFPHPYQFGFRRNYGAETAVLSLVESIAYYNERSSPVYCAFLDNEKAFDRIWLDGLFVKLRNLGIGGKMWRLLRLAYSSMQSFVRFEGLDSSSFPICQGVGQGRVMSAWLFTLFINDILYELESSKRGLQLPWGHCPGILLADDTTLVSSSTGGLQTLLEVVETYAYKWHLKYNVSKSAILCFGDANRTVDNIHLSISGVDIPQKCSIRYAGVLLSTGKSLERTKMVCEKLRVHINANHSHGLFFGGLNPIHAAFIWERVILACGLYGCSVWGKLTLKEYDMLETVQHYFCKKVQGFHPRTPSVTAADVIGLKPLQCYIEKRTLLFLGKLCNATCNSVFKKVFIVRFGQSILATGHDMQKWMKASPIFHMLHLL